MRRSLDDMSCASDLHIDWKAFLSGLERGEAEVREGDGRL